MNCPYCGAKNEENSVFCASCGYDMTDFKEKSNQNNSEKTTVLPTPSEQTAVHIPFERNRPTRRRQPRRKNNKPLLLAALGIVCVLTVITICTSIFRGNPTYHPYEHNILIEIDNGNVVILQDDKIAKPTKLEANRIQSHQACLDGSTVALLTNKGDLAVIRNNKLTVVAQKVTSYVLSVDGTGLGYVTQSADGKEYTLKLYNVKTKSTKEVICQQSNITFDLTPDGNSLAYYVQKDAQRTYTLFFFNGKKNTQIADNIVTLLGLSNKGKFIYAIVKDGDGEKQLYSFNANGNSTLIGPSSINVVYLNDDHTQILFYNTTYTDNVRSYQSYISTKGSSAERVISADTTASPLIPGNCVNYTTSTSITLPISSMYNKVYSCWGEDGQDLWMIRRNSKDSVCLATNTYRVTLSEDGEYVYYKTTGDWYSTLMVLKVKDGAKATEKATVLAENVLNFITTSDNKKVYYQTEEGIYCANGKTGKHVKTIASGEAKDCFLMNDEDILYYMVGSSVFASKNGSEGKLVLTGVQRLFGAANGIVYAITNNNCIYTTMDKMDPTLVWFED